MLNLACRRRGGQGRVSFTLTSTRALFVTGIPRSGPPKSIPATFPPCIEIGGTAPALAAPLTAASFAPCCCRPARYCNDPAPAPAKVDPPRLKATEHRRHDAITQAAKARPILLHPIWHNEGTFPFPMTPRGDDIKGLHGSLYVIPAV
jgi:hypothetical protein